MADQLERLVFFDETWLKTNMIRTTGWAPKGERLIDHAPFGRLYGLLQAQSSRQKGRRAQLR